MTAPASDSITQQVLRLHRGDDAALQQLLTDHLDWIAGQVRRRLGRAARRDGDTEDYVQLTLCEVLRSGPRFACDDPVAFRALLARIVENTLIDRVRYLHRQQRDRRREQDLPSGSVVVLGAFADPATAPPAKVAAQEEREWLRLALELLEPDDRLVVRLRDWEECSFAAVGERLGIAEEAARKRYARALPKLARKLEDLRQGRWQAAADAGGPAP